MQQHIEYNFVDRYGNPIPQISIDEIISATSQVVHSTDVCANNDFNNLNDKVNNQYSLEEKKVINEMLSVKSYEFRSDYKINNKKKRKIWNKIVSSLPKCKKKKVYRYLNEYDITDLYVGKILKIEHSLTTTQTGRGFMPKYNWIGKYIIKCKSLKKTKAHDVSVLWDSNCSILKGEKQINFEEGTSFLIDKIIYVHGKPYIYMHEI